MLNKERYAMKAQVLGVDSVCVTVMEHNWFLLQRRRSLKNENRKL